MTENAPTIDAATSLFRSGRFAELIRGALPFIADGRLSVEHRTLVAKAMLHVGDTEKAIEIAESANHATAKSAIRSRCELILGIASKRSADLDIARRRIQFAIRLAKEAGDTNQEAWSQLALLRLLAEGASQELLQAAFLETRRVVTRAADVHLTAYLHDTVSVMEAKIGRLNEAKRHLDIEASLLRRFPNAWLEQVMHTSRLCLACLECDLVSATSHAQKARKLRHITGGDGSEFALDINEAHVNIFRGRFEKGHASLQRVLRHGRGRGFARLSALDGLARIYLALNRLDDCESAVDVMLEARTDVAIAHCYTPRWALTIWSKLLMRRGNADSAIDCARETLKSAAAVRDHSLIAALAVIESEALAQRGDIADASVRLFEAAEDGAIDVREHAGQYFDVWSRVLSKQGCALAPLIRQRALRLWQSQGNVYARIESESRTSDQLPIRDLPLQVDRTIDAPPSTFQGDGQLTAAYVLNSICTAFDLSFDGRLTCAELTGVASLLNCADQLEVIERPAAKARRHDTDRSDRFRVELGAPDGSSLELKCSPSADPITNLALSNILRLARAAGALAQARIDDRNRAALWPAELVTAGDSLFISEEMTSLAATARKVAPTTVPVLITGETGTGKEILARAIHAASTRARAPFLPFNCSAGPRDMIDAQLFGHRRGAFTGATEHAPGVVRAAAGGTLFLDEIGESPLEVQPKLLRFLESGEIHPIGDPVPTRVDVRLIAATNIDLDAAVASGRFREDLFYRLNIVRLHLPPLRERRVEIPVFAQHYLKKHARDLGKGDLRLAEETVEYLLLYSWPGNVRQLANEMRRMAALAEAHAVLMPEHLSPDIVASRRTIPASERTLDAHELVVRLDQPLAAAMEHLERAIIPYAFKQCDGRVEDAARILGLSRKGLYLKRMRLGLETPEAHAQSA